MAATVSRAESLAGNQATFREINERLAALHDGRDATLIQETFLCECATDSCVDHVAITLAEYRQVRADPVTFVVFPNESHVFADVERVVEANSGYWVVEKQGAAAEVARAEARRRNADGGEDDRAAL